MSRPLPLAALLAAAAAAPAAVAQSGLEPTSQQLEDEAALHLWALNRAEAAYFGERQVYSAEVQRLGFEPDRWCPDAARMAVRAPTAPNLALGCHFVYEVTAADGRWSATAHGFGPAAGLERSGGPTTGRPSAADAEPSDASLGAATPSSPTQSRAAFVAEAIADLHLLYHGETIDYGRTARYSADPVHLLASAVPSCPAGHAARAADPSQLAGCDFVYSVAVDGPPFSQTATLFAHGVGRARGVDVAVDLTGDRAGIPYAPKPGDPDRSR